MVRVHPRARRLESNEDLNRLSGQQLGHATIRS